MIKMNLFRYKYWTIACRRHGTKPVYRQEQVTDLTVVLRAKSGIQADPFLIEKDGKSYLFYETAGLRMCFPMQGAFGKGRCGFHAVYLRREDIPVYLL